MKQEKVGNGVIFDYRRELLLLHDYYMCKKRAKELLLKIPAIASYAAHLLLDSCNDGLPYDILIFRDLTPAKRKIMRIATSSLKNIANRGKDGALTKLDYKIGFLKLLSEKMPPNKQTPGVKNNLDRCYQIMRQINDNRLAWIKKFALQKKQMWYRADIDELLSAGFVALSEAIDHFVPQKYTSFTKYAEKWIKIRINQYIRSTYFLKTPIRRPQKLSKPDNLKSMFWLTSEDGENIEIEDPRAQPSEKVVAEQELAMLKCKAINNALKKLPQRHAKVVMLYFGLRGQRKRIIEIAKMQNVSAQCISDMIISALRKMKRYIPDYLA
jgi:RNA polymerase sigma factor (sigma-70 family)